MTPELTNTLVTVFKVSQIPLIPILAFMCFKAISVINRKELTWVGFGFLGNFVYLLFSIAQDENLVHFTKDHIALFKGLAKASDIVTFLCFGLAIMHSFYRVQLRKKLKLKTLVNALRHRLFTFKKIFIICFFWSALYLLTYLSIDPNSRLLEDSISLFDFAILIILAGCFYRWSFKVYGKWQLLIGFAIWGIAQLLGIFFRHMPENTMQMIGFSISLGCKISILFGLLFWYLNFAIVTERKLSAIKENENAMANSSKFFQDILSRTFHELNIPLRSLGNSIERLSEHKIGRLSNEYVDLDCNYERVKTIIDVSINSYNSMDHFHDDRLESLPLADRSRVVNLNNLIEIAIRQVKVSYKGINFVPVYSKGCYIECNQALIVQVFTNLFKNAIEAYLPGEKKVITVRCFSTKARQANEVRHVIAEVEDYGIGILPEDIEKIWDPGYSTKTVDERNVVRGQGLALIRDVMRSHPTASIEVESPIRAKDGANTRFVNGTKFRLTFLKRLLPSEETETESYDN